MAVKDLDLLWSVEGDFILGVDGDLETTQNIQSRNLIQRVLKRLMSTPGDWAMSQDTGVSWDRVLGMKNNRDTGKLVEEMITSELMRGGLLTTSEFTVVAFPAGKRELGILLTISPTGVRGETTLTFVYDMRDNRIIPRLI
jgi:hypothetical protein